MEHPTDPGEDGAPHDGNVGSELRVCEIAGLKELYEAADRLLGSLEAQAPENRRFREIQIATFAAYEAKRDLKARRNWVVTWFYILFLIVTAISPILVACVEPAARGVAWDAFGIGSTMVLLYSTYGLYTRKMVWGWIQAIWSTIPDPPYDPANRLDVAKNSPKDEDRSNGKEAVSAIVLLLIGTWFAYESYLDLRVLYKMSTTAHDYSIFSQYYWSYFTWVLLLSLLFIIMDLSVATFNESHSDTYIAASSAMHVTVPMAIGIGLVWVYLWAEYQYSLRWSPGSDPWQSMSVEFASGALTFQMIISNVLFILIKKNSVFRLFYNTIHTTRRR